MVYNGVQEEYTILGGERIALGMGGEYYNRLIFCFIILIVKKVLKYTRWRCNIKMTVIVDNKHLC